jgi:hypothetical protein
MEKIMSPSLLRNHILASNQASQIVMFMLDNHDEVFQVPRVVQEQADIRITALKTGRLQPIMGGYFIIVFVISLVVFQALTFGRVT